MSKWSSCVVITLCFPQFAVFSIPVCSSVTSRTAVCWPAQYRWSDYIVDPFFFSVIQLAGVTWNYNVCKSQRTDTMSSSESWKEHTQKKNNLKSRWKKRNCVFISVKLGMPELLTQLAIKRAEALCTWDVSCEDPKGSGRTLIHYSSERGQVHGGSLC